MNRQASTNCRLDRRRARTRAALVRAARRFLAEDRTAVSILEITDAADVGLGSFYNHFDSKQALFDYAIQEILEAHGRLMDAAAEGIDDPAERFARSFRLTGRLHRHYPGASQVLLNNGARVLMSDRGLVPRALRDITAATAAGRFTIPDTDLALVTAAGSMLALGQLLHAEADRDAEAAADQLTEDLLRMFGLPPDEAAALCHRPLSQVAALIASVCERTAR
jgi:AcrR family transcriptional regulator